MYGAKATGIANVAFKVWVPGKNPSVKTRNAVERAIYALHDQGGGYEVTSDQDFPSVLAHDEFKRLVLALAAAAFTG